MYAADFLWDGVATSVNIFTLYLPCSGCLDIGHSLWEQSSGPLSRAGRKGTGKRFSGSSQLVPLGNCLLQQSMEPGWAKGCKYAEMQNPLCSLNDLLKRCVWNDRHMGKEGRAGREGEAPGARYRPSPPSGGSELGFSYRHPPLLPGISFSFELRSASLSFFLFSCPWEFETVHPRALFPSGRG